MNDLDLTPTYRFQNPDGSTGGRVADSAVIGPGAIISHRVNVNPKVVIGVDVLIESGSTIDVGAVIDDRVTIGFNTAIGEGVRIRAGTVIGNEVRVDDEASIGEGCIIGNDVTITGRADIGPGARIPTPRHVVSGYWSVYAWSAWRVEDGTIHLQYGCESHPLEWWDTQDLEWLSVLHTDSTDYVPILQALIALARTLPVLPEHDEQKPVELPAAQVIHIVFDGPPGPLSGRFVEVEDADGRSIVFGKWVERPDGYWSLMFSMDHPQ